MVVSRSKTAGVVAFSLIEVLIAGFVCALVFAGAIQCYILTAYRTEWSGYSVAAQALAVHQLEQARAAVWDPSSGRNEFTNLSLLSWTSDGAGGGRGYALNVLDTPISGTNSVTATNFVTIRMLYLNGATSPPVQLQLVRVDTVWPSKMQRGQRLNTNTVASYYAPDDR
jgi:Tfp pilus assembly protein PilV